MIENSQTSSTWIETIFTGSTITVIVNILTITSFVMSISIFRKIKKMREDYIFLSNGPKNMKLLSSGLSTLNSLLDVQNGLNRELRGELSNIESLLDWFYKGADVEVKFAIDKSLKLVQELKNNKNGEYTEAQVQEMLISAYHEGRLAYNKIKLSFQDKQRDVL